MVLDYGCAIGKKTLKFAAHVKNIHGIDISSKMIEEAKRKKDDKSIKNVVFLKGTIFDEKLMKESFNVIVAFGILHLLEDKEKIMNRIYELLTPDGIFISTTACLKEKMTLRRRIEFSMYLFIKKIGLFPLYLSMLTNTDVNDFITNGNFEIINRKNYFEGISVYYVEAKKKNNI